MTDAINNHPFDDDQPLPESQEVAMLAGALAYNLGADLSIQNGSYYLGRPEPIVFRLNGKGLPQLPGSLPHEHFRTDDEWRGGFKVVEYVLRRLCKEDKEFLFTLLAPAYINPNERFDFRDHLK